EDRTLGGRDQPHVVGDCAHAIEPERDRLRMLALDVRQPIGKRPCHHSARCTASPNSAVVWLASFMRTTSRCSTSGPSSRLSVVGAWRNVHRRASSNPSTL